MRHAALLILASGLTSCAHTAHESVPGHLDPRHHIRFQNGYVRVMETRLEPGQSTRAHSHPIEAAVVFLTDSTFEIARDDGSTESGSVERNTVTFGDSATVHRTRNAGEETARTVAVEIFSRPPASGEGRFDPGPGKTLLDNRKVRMARVGLEPGESTRPCGTAPSVLVALTPGRLGATGDRLAGKLGVGVGVGDVLWCEPGEGSIRNIGNRRFEAILVLLKPRAPRS